MSWDIFIQDIPKTAQSARDIPDDFRPRALGARTDVLRRIQEVVPTVDFSDPSCGTFNGQGFSVEFNVGDADEIECVALHVRGGEMAAGLVADLLARCGWRAFDTAAESGFFDPATAVESLRRWRAYRDQVLSAGAFASEIHREHSVFQLVLQFAPWSDRGFDDLIRLEDQLSSVVPPGAIDGHDLGSNEANIFLFTDEPDSVLQSCLHVITQAGLLSKFSAGCRSLDRDDYSRVWPVGDSSPFSVT
jgi:hypothetical protein